MEIIKLSKSIRLDISEKEKLGLNSSTLTGLASGLDVGLTLSEQSIGPFEGLTKSKANDIKQCFLHESKKFQNDNLEMSIWYFSYVKAIKKLFLPEDKN